MIRPMSEVRCRKVISNITLCMKDDRIIMTFDDARSTLIVKASRWLSDKCSHLDHKATGSSPAGCKIQLMIVLLHRA